jgi:hypothetical protein
MLPLHTATFPSSAAELERLLNETVERVFISKPHPVRVCDHSYPRLYEIDVSLDRARLRPGTLSPPIAAGEISPALEIDQFTLNASPLSVGPAVLNLSVSASEIRLGQRKDSNEQVVVLLQSAAEGKIRISMGQDDVEALITELARSQASKQGVTIDGVQLTLRQESVQSLAVAIHLRARKLFLGASLRVTGQLDLDDQFNLKVSRLHCTGDGGIATLACGILKPYLEKVDGHTLPLMPLALKGISFREVRIVADDNVAVTAEFGSAA